MVTSTKRDSKLLVAMCGAMAIYVLVPTLSWAASTAPLTTNQLHAVMGIVTNFILDDGPPVKIKKTGQNQSYDESGNVVTDGSIKDDGFYQKGVTPRYTRDDTTEIVTDLVTGLMWQDDGDVGVVTKPWLSPTNYGACSTGNPAYLPACYSTYGDTAATYCQNLTLGGYTDWRLPTDKELGNIMYYRNIPAIDSTSFQNWNTSSYWSSTTYSADVQKAWEVVFYVGGISTLTKDSSLYIRCVRGGE